MSPWTGHMQTSLLNDRKIRPTEYRKWRDAVRKFERRDKDRQTVERYKEQILSGRLRQPLQLGIDDRYHDVYVGDGHHRAVALIQLGIQSFPFHWYWITSSWGRPRMERQPFPHHLVNL